MRCFEIKECLESYLDDEISSETRREIKRHLDSCAACLAELESLQLVSGLVRRELPVSAPKKMDEKVFATFRQHHEKKKKARWNWLAVWGGFLVPKPVFATLTICFLAGLAFWLGRMTAPAKEVVVLSPPQIIEKSVPTETIKYVEVPIAKYVKIPVEKERIVTRTIYQNVETPRRIESTATRQIFQNTETARQLNLKDFQPLGEITPKILKKGETNER